MTAKLKIVFTREVLSALRASKSMKIAVGSGGNGHAASPRATGGGGASGGADEPKAGTLPARVLGWAKGRGKPFGTADITGKFKLTRAHASMLLSRLASGPHAIKREKRGLYRYGR